MKRSSVLLCALASVIALVAIAALTPLVEGQTPKRGGILHSVLIEDPPGLLIHESATVSSEETDRLIDQQSQELDRNKRFKITSVIQKKLEADVARPMLGWRKEHFVQWPYVRNLVPHNSLYNYARMQEVWLDK